MLLDHISDALIVILLRFQCLECVKHEAYSVLIVGGGMSGLSAAQHLISKGVKNIAVVEAKDRLGGRIYTKHLRTGPIEFGAQWIHGGQIVNNVFNLANLHKLLSNETCDAYEGPLITRNGTFVNEEFVKRVKTNFEDLLKCEKKHVSLENCLNENYGKLLSKFTNEEKEIVREYFNVYKVRQVYDNGHELNTIAAVNDYITIPCDLDIINGTNRLLQNLIEVIGEQIFLEHAVVNINWTHSIPTVTVKHRDSVFTINAHNVIVTVSLGYLKQKHSSFFHPHLPKQKVNAIQELVFGQGVKVMMFYKNPFWRRNYFKTHWLGITDEMYLTGNKGWINRIVEFAELDDNPNVLVTIAFGNIAIDVELLDNVILNQKLTELLRNYTKDETIPEADVIYKSQWNTDEFTLGTYSLPGLKYNNDFEKLATPLPEKGEPRLFFAGEATSKSFFGTMHGAREAGIREANRILTKLSNTKTKPL